MLRQTEPTSSKDLYKILENMTGIMFPSNNK